MRLEPPKTGHECSCLSRQASRPSTHSDFVMEIKLSLRVNGGLTVLCTERDLVNCTPTVGCDTVPFIYRVAGNFIVGVDRY